MTPRVNTTATYSIRLFPLQSQQQTFPLSPRLIFCYPFLLHPPLISRLSWLRFVSDKCAINTPNKLFDATATQRKLFSQSPQSPPSISQTWISADRHHRSCWVSLCELSVLLDLHNSSKVWGNTRGFPGEVHLVAWNGTKVNYKRLAKERLPKTSEFCKKDPLQETRNRLKTCLADWSGFGLTKQVGKTLQ